MKARADLDQAEADLKALQAREACDRDYARS
jgi:hypothetical protein